MLTTPLLKGGTALLDAQAILSRCEIQAGFVVADLGCGGNGHFVAPLAHMVGSAGLIYAVDIQKNVLNSVEAKLKMLNITNVMSVWSDLEKVGAAKIHDGSCHIAFIINVLFQNKEHGAIMAEALRMVRPGGRLVVIDWKPLASPLGPAQELRVSPTEVKRYADQLHIKLYNEFDAGQYHYAEVFST